MITSEQHRLVEEKAYAFDHNYLYYGLISGEPFLLNDSLFYYFDGRKLSIHLIELDPGLSRDDLHDILYRLKADFQPEAVVIWGPDPMETVQAPRGWERHVLAESGPYRRDMALALDSYDPGKVPNLEDSRSYAVKNGVEMTAQKRQQFTAEHILLLEDMIRRSHPDIFDRVFYTVGAAWLLDSESIVFEAREDGRLMGYVILDLSIATLPMMMIGCYKRKPPVFSDLLYDAVIRYCVGKGHGKLVFGHSYTEGQYRYKRKWGRCVVQPGVWEVMLSGSASRVGPRNYPWLARVLRE